MKLFITGTDTEVGKTYATASLLRALRARGRAAVGGKPFCCGERTDAELLAEAAGQALTLHEVNPVWLRAPAAPYVAAMIEGRPLDLAATLESMRALGERFQDALVEGVGGWEVPLTRECFVSHFATELGWPVLVVAANKLGALNHTLLTVQAVRACGLPVAGVLLNAVQAVPDETNPAATTNHAVLESLLACPVWQMEFGASFPTAAVDALVSGVNQI